MQSSRLTALLPRAGNFRRSGLLAVAILACLTLSDAHEEHEALAGRGTQVLHNTILLDYRAWQALDPQLARVERRTLRRTVLATGQLTVPPNGRAYASTWLPGRIEKIEAELGQAVQAGQILAWIRSADWEKFLADYTVAQNQAAAARLEWQRVDSLYREGLASRQEWLEAQARYRETENALLVSRLQVQALSENLPATETLLPVRSPIAGRVTRLLATVGRETEPRNPLVEIVDASRLWFQAKVPQFYSALVKSDQYAEIHLRAFPQVGSLPARVLARTRQIDPQTLTETVWLELVNPPALDWRVGMQGIAQVEVARRENVLAIPTAAVYHEGMETYAFVVRDPEECCADHDHASHPEGGLSGHPHAAYERVLFTPGLITPDWVEVRDGLQEGEQVVTVGRHQLAVLVPPPGEGEFRISRSAWEKSGLRVEPVSYQAVQDTVVLEASLEVLPAQRWRLHAPVAGMLRHWCVTTSSPVHPGQALVELDSWELQQWQLAWLQAELSAQIQEALVTAYRDLLKQGLAISDQVLRRAELSWHSARTLAATYRSRLTQVAGLSLTQLEALRKEHKLVRTLTLRATQGGWCVPEDFPPGQFVTSEHKLSEIVSVGNPQIRARLPEFAWNQIRVGQTARFRPAWLGRPVWAARVFYLEETVSENNQRFLWAQLQNPPQNVPLYLTGTLTVETNGSATAVLAVPATAIWWEGNQPAVFVYHRDRDSFEYRPVGIGRTNDQWAEIKTGLEAGEEIAVSAVPDLRRHYGRLRTGTGIYCDHCRD